MSEALFHYQHHLFLIGSRTYIIVIDFDNCSGMWLIATLLFGLKIDYKVPKHSAQIDKMYPARVCIAFCGWVIAFYSIDWMHSYGVWAKCLQLKISDVTFKYSSPKSDRLTIMWKILQLCDWERHLWQCAPVIDCTEQMVHGTTYQVHRTSHHDHWVAPLYYDHHLIWTQFLTIFDHLIFC